jgi:dolichyl-phosphate-mannose--protein O-mannosyl transferase
VAGLRARLAWARSRPWREGTIDRRPGWSRLDWIALLTVTAGAALLRLPGLSRPVGFVFDEIWYARNACRYVIGTAECGIDQLASRAHPPLGNWMVGAGIKAFGYDEFGWRISAAVVGTITVALLFLLTWQMLRQASPTARTVGAFAAAALLAGDFLHIVQSRVGMLDAFVTLFVVAAILFAVHDRDRPRAADWERRPGGILSALALHRPWRLLAGMALGAAVAVKWSGAYVALAVIGLTAAWEIAARRSGGPDAPPRSWSSATWLAIREELPRSVVLLGLVPAAVYLAAYIGRMPGELIGLPWQEGTVWRGIWDHQQAMLTFHTTLSGSHPYESPPWSWLLLKRPVAYYFATGDGYREILAIGNPLTWAAGVIGLVVLAVLWARGGWRVGGPAAVVIVAAVATYLPWLALQGSRSQVFLWYILPTIPFLYAGLGVLTALAWRSWAGRSAVAAFAIASVVLLAFFFPLLTALPVSPDAWRARMWLTTCARPDAPTLELPDSEISSGPAPDGWCWI